jgi:hypothetical protein
VTENAVSNPQPGEASLGSSSKRENVNADGFAMHHGTLTENTIGVMESHDLESFVSQVLDGSQT